MRKEATLQNLGGIPLGAGFDLWGAVQLFPRRVRNLHFWLIQAVIAATTALHYGLEASSDWGDVSSIHHIPVTFYLIAVLYAGIQFRLEGGILTALWVVILTTPSLIIWHRHSSMWIGEVAQLFVSLAVGAVVAWRVELEMVHRRQAEAAGRRMALLNQVSAAATQTLDLNKMLPNVLAQVAEALDAKRAWISTWESGDEQPMLLAEIGEALLTPGADPPRHVWQIVSREVQETGTAASYAGRTTAVPLVAEGKLVGALGVGCPDGGTCGSDDLELLVAMGNHIAVALDNSRLYRDELRMQEELRAYARQVTRAHEEERKRISRELHDDVVQDLILICRELDATGEPVPGDEGGSQAVRGLVDSLLQKVRRFSRDLRPSVLDDLGLIPAIEWLGTDLSKRTGIAAGLEVRGEPLRMPPERELLMFRVVQEALRNVEKHARASAVKISVESKPGEIEVSIADDGKGFKIAQLKKGDYSGRVGLLGMRERAKLAGGSLDVTSQPGRGTRIAIRVPA